MLWRIKPLWKLTEYCIMPYKLNYQWIISTLLSLLIESFAFIYYNGPHKFMIVLQRGHNYIEVYQQPLCWVCVVTAHQLKCVTVEEPTAL